MREQKRILGHRSVKGDGVSTLHQHQGHPKMRIQTMRNRVEKFKSFLSAGAILEECAGGLALAVRMRARTNSRPYDSVCRRPGPAFDRLGERRFEFVPI